MGRRELKVRERGSERVNKEYATWSEWLESLERERLTNNEEQGTGTREISEMDAPLVYSPRDFALK